MAKISTIHASSIARIDSLSAAFETLDNFRAIDSTREAVSAYFELAAKPASEKDASQRLTITERARNKINARINRRAKKSDSLESFKAFCLELEANFFEAVWSVRQTNANKLASASNLRAIFGTANLRILWDERCSMADTRKITTGEAMSAPYGITPGTESRHNAPILPKTRADKSENGDCQTMRERDAVTTYNLLGIASASGMQDGRWTTVHAMAHGKKLDGGDEAFAIMFRAENNGTENATDVPWVNPSTIDAELLTALVETAVVECNIDAKRLRFFVDSSIEYRCENMQVTAFGKAFTVRTAAATADLLMKASKFAPMLDDGTGRVSADFADEPNKKAKAAPECSEVKDVTADYLLGGHIGPNNETRFVKQAA